MASRINCVLADKCAWKSTNDVRSCCAVLSRAFSSGDHHEQVVQSLKNLDRDYEVDSGRRRASSHTHHFGEKIL
jgi:hypothetical protein